MVFQSDSEILPDEKSVSWRINTTQLNDSSHRLYKHLPSTPSIDSILKKDFEGSKICPKKVATFETAFSGSLSVQNQDIDREVSVQNLRDKKDLLEREKDAKKYLLFEIIFFLIL